MKQDNKIENKDCGSEDFNKSTEGNSSDPAEKQTEKLLKEQKESLKGKTATQNGFPKPNKKASASTTMCEIHPALDFTEEYAFVGHETKNSLSISKEHFLIRDDKTKIPCELACLKKEKITLLYPSCSYYPKWTLDSINEFIKGIALKPKPNDLLQDINKQIKKYIELSDERFYNYITLWTIGTYFFPLFNSYPYVYLNGPSQSGKTKLLTLCSLLSFNGQLSLHMNAAGVFRMVDNSRCSLFIDEREELIEKSASSEFRTMLLGGYKKGGTVQRMEKDAQGNFEPKSFSTFSPKMLANIAGIDRVLESRCIAISMQKSNKASVINTEVAINDSYFGQIRDELFLFMMENWKSLKQSYSEFILDGEVSGRELELWKPIFSLAKFFGPNILEEMQSLAKVVVAERKIDAAETNESILLKSLLTVASKTDYYKLSEIKDVFASYTEGGTWLNEQYIGKLLRRFGFKERKRKNDGYRYKIDKNRVESLAESYGVTKDNEESEDSEHSEPVPEQSIKLDSQTNGDGK